MVHRYSDISGSMQDDKIRYEDDPNHMLILDANDKKNSHICKNIRVVNPKTGEVIPYVFRINFERDLLTVPVTTLTGSEPGMKMQFIKDGNSSFVREYTFVRLVDTFDGKRSFMEINITGEFDVVDQSTGIVLHESRSSEPISLKYLDPDMYWSNWRKEYNLVQQHETHQNDGDFNIELIRKLPNGGS